jgi:hypothetical protein
MQPWLTQINMSHQVWFEMGKQIKARLVPALAIYGALVAATDACGSEYRRELYASVGNWQIVRTITEKTSFCLIQNVYDGHTNSGSEPTGKRRQTGEGCPRR